jgi:phosphodiesterase/alkaline phosphatase D-like protein
MATGSSSSATPYLIPTGTGVTVTSILTVGDTASLFSDNFDSEANSLTAPLLNKWNVTRGSVDVIGNGSSFDFLPGNGRYLDLDGSTSSAARIETKDKFSFKAGDNISLSFFLAGSQRSDKNTVVVSFGTLFSESITLDGNAPLAGYTRNFKATADGSASIVFDHAGGDNAGLTLDNVKLNNSSSSPNSGYRLAGIPDGLGAFDNNNGTFTLLVNHEIGNTVGAAHGPLTAGAFVSQWVIKKSDLSVVSGGDLIKNVYSWDAATQKSSATALAGIAFNRFCSADLASVSAYYNSATGLGTAERIFLNGEEGGSTGYAVATVSSGANKGNAFILGKFDLNTNGSSTSVISSVQLNVATASTTSTAVTLSGAAPRELAVGAQLLGQTVTAIATASATAPVPGLVTVTLSGNANKTITAATPTDFTLAGVGGWENFLANPYTQNKTVVIGNNDGGTGIMSGAVAVYVGTKTNTGSEVDKAGLTNGVTKFVNITGSPAEIVDTKTRATNIKDGTAFTLSATSSTAFSRPEDGAWNPSSPNQYFFVTTDQLDQVNDGVGTQIGRSRLWRLNFADITNTDAGGTIDLLLDGTEGQTMFDNLTVDRYGHITLLEDTGNAQHNGKTWQYDIATDKLTQLTKFDPARFGDIVPGVAGAASTNLAATLPFNIDEETSGVIDVQDILGAGYYLIDVQAHNTIADPNLVEGGQLLALYNPTTAASAATVKGKVAFSGVAAGDATTSSEILWTRTVDAGTQQGITSNLTVQVATDDKFTTIAKTYTGITDANRDYTLKLDATGLASGTKYYYRFVTPGGDTSAVGTFKTELAADAKAAVKFGFSGDVDGLFRPYSSTADFGKLNLDFFAFIGDTIYETASKSSVAAADPNVSAAQALIDYRAKYLENLTPTKAGGFTGLQTFFASQGNYTALDNHELGNKQLINGGAPASLAALSGNGTADTTLDVNKTGKFINSTDAFKTLERAFLEYQPVREKIISAPTDARTDGTVQLYNANQWGQNVLYLNTDTRSYRDVRLKTAAGADDTGVRADNVDRTLLGKTQLAWLKQNLLDAQKNGTIWKFVSVTDPIDQIGAIGSGEDGGKSWIGGYRAERNDLLKFIADNGIKNVVFLSADDHQNRINEITYLDNINDPKSVKVLANALSIVDGPLGATGPDGNTDHSFAAIKKLADDLAAKQTAAGVNPIGLSANFAGLKNVVREGDPDADKLRQAVDFYSPDTFNYTVFDISADGKTLNVNVQGVNSYLKDTNPEPSAANPVRSILSFSLDAALPLPVLNVAATTATTSESGGAPAVFKVTSVANNIPVPTAPITFNYAVTGTATNGDDYTKLTGTATLDVGKTSVDIPVTAIDDSAAEGTESVTLTITGGGSTYLVDSTKAVAAVTITDNELTPVGSTGNDTLEAAVGAKFDGQSNIIFAGAGNDKIDAVTSVVGNGNNRIDAGSGNDLIYIADADRVFGSAGNDELDARDAKDYRASGGAGNDIFYLGTNGKALGGDGDDKFYATLGNGFGGGGNTISGGAGVDQFWIASGDAPTTANTILDFQIGTDVIGIAGIGATAANVVLTQVGADTTIGFGTQTLAILKGIQASSLTPSNAGQFVFA